MRFVEADIIVSKNSSLPYIIRLLIKIKMEFHGRIIWAEKFGAGDATNFQAKQAQSVSLWSTRSCGFMNQSGSNWGLPAKAEAHQNKRFMSRLKNPIKLIFMWLKWTILPLNLMTLKFDSNCANEATWGNQAIVDENFQLARKKISSRGNPFWTMLLISISVF